MRDWFKAILILLLTEGVWIVLLGGVLVQAETGSFDVPLRPTPIVQAGIVLLVIGLGLSSLANYELIAAGATFPIGTRKPEVLWTKGMYERVRNPQSLAMVLSLLGAAVAVDSNAIWVLPTGAAVYLWLLVIPVEQRRLEEVLGQAYVDYRSSVPGWLPLTDEERSA